MKVRIGFRDILTTVSLKLKKSILKLVAYVFLIISAHCFKNYLSPSIISLGIVGYHWKKFPQTSLALSHTLDTTVLSFLRHKNVIG